MLILLVPQEGFEPPTPSLRIMQQKSLKRLISCTILRDVGSPWHRLGTDGAADRIRTYDPRITNAVLYRLSYCGAETGYIPLRPDWARAGGGEHWEGIPTDAGNWGPNSKKLSEEPPGGHRGLPEVLVRGLPHAGETASSPDRSNYQGSSTCGGSRARAPRARETSHCPPSALSFLLNSSSIYRVTSMLTPQISRFEQDSNYHPIATVARSWGRKHLGIHNLLSARRVSNGGAGNRTNQPTSQWTEFGWGRATGRCC
jgi:hypothetical protein